jgi:hypothetical protein
MDDQVLATNYEIHVMKLKNQYKDLCEKHKANSINGARMRIPPARTTHLRQDYSEEDLYHARSNDLDHVWLSSQLQLDEMKLENARQNPAPASQ